MHKLEGKEKKECSRNGSSSSSKDNYSSSSFKSTGSKIWSSRDLLYRSISERRGRTKDNLWSLSFFLAKQSKKEKQLSSSKKSNVAKHSKSTEKHSHAHCPRKTNNNNVANPAPPKHDKRPSLLPHKFTQPMEPKQRSLSERLSSPQLEDNGLLPLASYGDDEEDEDEDDDVEGRDENERVQGRHQP
eukprot:Gb_30443 [translate_table: standard]